jgi:hypothetical protein
MRQQHIALQSAESSLSGQSAIAPARISRDNVVLENLSARHGMARADGDDSMSEWLPFLQFSTRRITLNEEARIENGINVNSERRPKNALTRGCDIQRQVQQRYTTALDPWGLLRLCLCLPSEPAILNAWLGDWSDQKRRILR